MGAIKRVGIRKWTRTLAKPEPWLRGILPGLNPVIEHLLRASEQIREDFAAAIGPLTTSQIRATPHNQTSAGFHAKHLAGSTHRLCTYLEGDQLTPAQLAAIPGESEAHDTAAGLIAQLNHAFDRYETIVRNLRPEQFSHIREIGRRRLQTTAISLAIHIAEHGQRHTGQAISAAKLAQAVTTGAEGKIGCHRHHD